MQHVGRDYGWRDEEDSDDLDKDVKESLVRGCTET